MDESGADGLKVCPFFVVVVVPAEVVVGPAVLAVPSGEVMAGIETLGVVVVSPELSLPHPAAPAAIAIAAMATVMRRRGGRNPSRRTRRRGRAVAVRNTGSR